MSFIAKLQLQNEDEISVLRCGFRFNQTIDVTGKAASRPMGGTINIILSSINHPSLFEWMINTQQKKSGRITFIRYDTMSKLKTLEFENALCVEYHETFDPDGAHPITLQLTLSAHTIKLEDMVYKNNWPGL
jgi:hypothetical protein